MSLESLGALRQLIQVREQSQTIQNDNLERVQNSVQQTSTAEAQRSDQLNLEKAKAKYEVALAQATVERIQSQLDREVKATNNALLGVYLTAGLAAADSIMNANRDLKGQQKLKDSNAGSGVDPISKNNAKVIGGMSGNDIYIGSSVPKPNNEESITFKVGKDGKPGEVDVDKAIKAGLLTKAPDGSLSVTDLGNKYGLKVDSEKDEKGKIKTDTQGNTIYKVTGDQNMIAKGRFVDEDMAVKYGMATRNTNGDLQTTFKGQNAGLGTAGDKMSSVAADNLDVSQKGETILRATTAPGQNQVQYFQAATISQEDIEMKAKQRGIDLKGNVTFEGLMKADPKAAEELFNERAHDIKGVEAVDAQEAFKGAIKRSADDEKNKIDSTTDPENVKNSKKTGLDNRVKELSTSLEDKLLKDGKSNMGISTGEKAKYIFNALVSFADAVVPQIQAYMAARDRMEKTAIELAAAMEKLAAAEKKLKALEDMITTLGALDGLGSGTNQVEKGL
ncbi:MAG: hypothetical protein U0354_14430 [Candidatus Sericytochromatia bacterium]